MLRNATVDMATELLHVGESLQ